MIHVFWSNYLTHKVWKKDKPEDVTRGSNHHNRKCRIRLKKKKKLDPHERLNVRICWDCCLSLSSPDVMKTPRWSDFLI